MWCGAAVCTGECEEHVEGVPVQRDLQDQQAGGRVPGSADSQARRRGRLQAQLQAVPLRFAPGCRSVLLGPCSTLSAALCLNVCALLGFPLTLTIVHGVCIQVVRALRKHGGSVKRLFGNATTAVTAARIHSKVVAKRYPNVPVTAVREVLVSQCGADADQVSWLVQSCSLALANRAAGCGISGCKCGVSVRLTPLLGSNAGDARSIPSPHGSARCRTSRAACSGPKGIEGCRVA